VPLDNVFQFCLVFYLFSNQYMKKDQFGDIPVIDKVVQVCSALNNLCPSVVPFT